MAGLWRGATPVRGDAPLHRFLARHPGGAGYILILDNDDIAVRRQHLQALGARLVTDLSHDGFQTLQVHPRDAGACMLEFDHTDGGEAWAGRCAPAGPHWQRELRLDRVSGIAGVVLCAADAPALAERWAALIGVAATLDANGRLQLPGGFIAFEAAAPGGGRRPDRGRAAGGRPGCGAAAGRRAGPAGGGRPPAAGRRAVQPDQRHAGKSLSLAGPGRRRSTRVCSLAHRPGNGGMRPCSTYARRHPAPPHVHVHVHARAHLPPRSEGAGSMILQRLKQATAAAHAAIESHSVLLDPGLTRATYRASLRRFFGYYAPLEARMLRSQAWRGAGLCYHDRHKTPQLSRDLAALGDTPEELAQTPLCHALPDLRSTARLFGCLYVIEGATLGGQIVTRHLQAKLAVTPQSGGAFFSGYAEHTGSRWKAFGAHLIAYAQASQADDDIVAGASATFETLGRWLYPATAPATSLHPAR